MTPIPSQPVLVPQLVPALPAATAIDVGSAVSCAVAGVTVLCWGNNTFGQLGDGTTAHSEAPVQAQGVGAVAHVATSGVHTCVVRTDATARCWGLNNHGQIGDGTTDDSIVPKGVLGLTGATAIAASSTHTCAATDRGLYCWGDNTYGQLGTGDTVTSAAPKQVVLPGR